MAVKPSLYDKILKEVAPGKAVSRLWNKHRFEVMSSPGSMPSIMGRIGVGAYDAADDTRMRTHHAFGRSLPVTEEEALGPYAREKVRLECWDLYRNNEIARAAVDRFVSYAVWNGIWPQAQTSKKEWNKEAEDWWRQIYVPACDFRQRAGVNLISYQKLIVTHRLLDGECAFGLLANGQLMPIEAARIRDPVELPALKNAKITQGVKMTKKGIILGYYVCNRDKNGNVKTSDFKFVRREDIIHCMEPVRIDQIRGVPDLAPVTNKMRDYDTTDQNVLNTIKSHSTKLFKRFTKDGEGANDAPRGGYIKTDAESKDPQKVEKGDWGEIANLRPGEDMEAFKSETPNQQYVAYMEHELRSIAAALNIPYEYMMLIFTKANFSSARAAMLMAQHTFLELHEWIVRCFLQRLWNWRIAKAMKPENAEISPAPIDKNGVSEWYKVEWSVPFLGWVDPDKQAKADSNDIKAGRTSLKASIKSRGRDRDDVFSEKEDDIRAAKARAKTLNDEFKEDDEKVTWRDIADIGADPKGNQGPQL